MSPADRRAALALYETACVSHRRKDWRLACDALARVVLAMDDAPAEVSEPVTAWHEAGRILVNVAEPVERRPGLLEFLSVIGGIRDDGGELAGLDAGSWHMAGGGVRACKRRRGWGSQLVPGYASAPRRGVNGRLLGPLINPSGLSLSHAAERAQSAGYFSQIHPDDMAGPDDLIAAIDHELRADRGADDLESRFGPEPGESDQWERQVA